MSQIEKNSSFLTQSYMFDINQSKAIDGVLIKSDFCQNVDENIEDPFDSMWLKLIAISVYIFLILSSGLMIAFTKYEQLYHGHYRTVINQLLSNLYMIVSKLAENPNKYFTVS